VVLENEMTDEDAKAAIEATKDKLTVAKMTATLAEEFRNGELKKVIKLKK
jgi:hypothetical protein